jgi:hypothetical protein
MKPTSYPFKGTVQLLELTESLPENKKSELFSYIGRLESHIKKLHQDIKRLNSTVEEF